MFLGHQTTKIFSPSGLCHGPLGRLTAPYSYTNLAAAFRTMNMFHAHILWALSMLMMSTFFSSTFDQTKYLKYSCSYISIQNNEYQQNINKNFKKDQ